jgi:BCD family chlorophyll transporter-like MFS transporter
MGLDFLLIGVVLGGGHYLGALAAIPFGFYSDRHPIRGLYRTPYILAGITAVCLALAASPFVVREIAAQDGSLWIIGGFIFFLVEGIGTYIAGTAYLALITDLTTEAERGRAVAIVWTSLMIGILVGVFYSVLTLREYSFAALSLSFAAAAGGVWVLALIALGRQERRTDTKPSSDGSASLRESFNRLASSCQARYFFAFLVVGLFSTFMQDVILEPFGGEVLQLPVRATSLFNAYLMVGVIAAMWLGGVQLIPRYGKEAVTALRAWVQVAAFVLLALSGFLHWAWLASLSILALGVGMGLFTVGGVSLMMDMTHASQTGLFVGAWTLAQALAKGPAAIASGGLHNAARALGAEPAGAYAAVFIVEAIGLALAVWLLRQVGVPRFRQEVAPFSTVVTQTID